MNLTENQVHPEDVIRLTRDPRRFRFERGVQLVVATENWEPHAKLSQDSSGELSLAGPISEVLHILATSLNFTFVLRRSPGHGWGTLLTNGSWSGMIGMLHRKEADLATGPFAITSERLGVVDFTTPLFSDPTLLLGARGRPEVDPWGFLLSMAPSVWVATLAALVTVVVAATLLAFPRSWRRLPSNVFTYLRVFLNQGEEASRDSGVLCAGRSVLAGWILTSLVVGWAYMGGLTSLLAVRHVSQPFQTLASVAHHPFIQLVVEKDTAEVNYIQSGADRTTAQYFTYLEEEGRLQYQIRSTMYLSMIRGAPYVVLVEGTTATWTMNLHFSLSGQCDFYTSREILLSLSYSISVQKGSPLLHAINSRVMAMTEAGLYGHWLQNAIPNSSYCRHQPATITIHTALSFANLWAVFLALAGGLASSLVAFACELVCKRPGRDD